MISVIVPTLNEEARIGACLRSIGSMTDAEIVVSDGGSTDATLTIVGSIRPEAVVVAGESGRGGQLNRGADAASADRMLFLHADCELPNGWTGPVNQALDDPQISLATYRLRTRPADGSEPGIWRAFWLSLFDLRSRGWGLPYGDQGFAIRRDVLDTLGGFPEIPLMEDFAFARECSRHGRIERLPLEIRTTSRRYDGRPFTSRLILAAFPTLFRIGVRPETLARWYGDIR